MFSSQGVLHYSLPHKLVVLIDENISSYYRKLVPKYFICQPQMYAPHITVIRKEEPSKMHLWGKYEGHEVSFTYDPYIHSDGVYWWLNVDCPRLTEIRTELGLEPWTVLTRPPDGCEWFHTTIGNSKISHK
ncbi:MAG: hypothetical protein WC761_01920 [Candidatus Paceibacterota bacterium]|jgi:hypothetical protein